MTTARLILMVAALLIVRAGANERKEILSILKEKEENEKKNIQ
jgi:hypothetical protein